MQPMREKLTLLLWSYGCDFGAHAFRWPTAFCLQSLGWHMRMQVLLWGSRLGTGRICRLPAESRQSQQNA